MAAQANRESGDGKKNQSSGDFSLVQAGSVDSILKNTSWPRQDDSSSVGSRTNRSLPTEETVASNQIYASHYAFSTAYARVTKKLAAVEQRNKQLMMQDSLRGQDSFRSAKMSGSAGSQTNFAIPPEMEASVNQAWEAYNEKCKECQQLREELEEATQKNNNNAEHHSSLQNLREDVLREKAKQGDVVRRLEETKMETDHLEKKEILAREELEKERESLKSIIESAEKKHREMEQSIEELERTLANEKCLTEDLRKQEGNRQKNLEDKFHSKKETFITKINELEGRNIHLKEEVSVLLSMQSANFNGPASGPQINGLIDGTQAAGTLEFDSDKDIIALELDIQSLKLELSDLKAQTSEQCSILSAVLQNPKTASLLGSTNYFQENAGALPSVEKCNGVEVVHKRKKTDSPRLRNHASNFYSDGHSVDSTSSLQDIYGPSTANVEQFPNSRQIPPKHSDDTSALSVPIIKHAEDVIRDISNEGTTQHRKVAKPAFANENLFSPMDVSGVIHAPESGGPRTTTADRLNSSENFNSDTTPRSGKYFNTGPTALPTGSCTGNVMTSIRPRINGQPPITMQKDRLSKLPPQASSNLVTPGNRYVPSSDEESDSDSFHRISPQETGPREFVVPKVVRAEDLATAQAASNRKAFLDSVYSAPQVHSQTRPAIRAKAESPSHQSDARATRPEANGSVTAAHQYPSSSSRTKMNQEDDMRCPVCDFVCSSDWTEEKMTRHINGHFSDEDNNVLSFD